MKKQFFTLTFSFLVLLLLNTLSFQAQVQQEWVRKFNGPGVNKGDISTAITNDVSGNIYVTGQVSGYGADYDYLTMKYNNAGVRQWAVQFHGPLDTSNNYADAIAVDASGNVYVTGFSAGIGTYNDFETIKYTPTGIQVWEARYNGPGNTNDNGRAIAVDAAGNVYVTGESYGTLYDFATVKYNSNGVQQWAARYNGPGNNADFPNSLAVDTNGNVYVTGSTINGNTTMYATVKYNSSGVQQWASIYNGTANTTSIAYAIALDAQGFVYVTGRSWQTGTSEDAVTIKYNPSTGDSVWVKKFNSPGNGPDEGYGITTDVSNNIYVTGAANDLNAGTWGIIDVKYNSAGVQQWAIVYTPPGRQATYGKKISVDSQGNTYIGGYSLIFTSSLHTEDYLMAKFDANGVYQWSQFYNGTGNDRDEGYGMVIDNSGNSYITGLSYAGYVSGSCDYTTVKYNSAGVQQWEARYNYPVRGNDQTAAMKIDNSGNIYVAGTSVWQAEGSDIVLLKFNSSGDTQWVRRYDSPALSNDNATCMEIDSAGNIYVGGGSWNPSFQLGNYTVLKYSPSGTLLWSSGIFEGGYTNVPRSIAADGSGNVYVFGTAGGSPFNHYELIKYNQNGDTVWSKSLSATSRTAAQKVVTDMNGNVYVTGLASFNIYTIKLNSNGDTLWTASYNGLGNSTDQPLDMYVDVNGNVYVTGYTMTASTIGSEDYVTIKYNSSGVQQWAKTYNGPGNGHDAAASIAVDSLGYVSVTGTSFAPGSGYDYETIKYTPSGDTVWTQRYNGSGNNIDFAASICGRFRNVFVTGGTKSGNVYNLTTLKYDTLGALKWQMTYSANLDSANVNPVLVTDRLGNVYAAGTTFENGTDYDIVLIKYSEPVGIKQLSNDVPVKYNLYQNYPNPFNPSTVIKFQIPLSRGVSARLRNGQAGRGVLTQLIIYDILGRESASLINGELNPGTYELTWDASSFSSGIYFYQLVSGGNMIDTKKMILLK